MPSPRVGPAKSIIGDVSNVLPSLVPSWAHVGYSLAGYTQAYTTGTTTFAQGTTTWAAFGFSPTFQEFGACCNVVRCENGGKWQSEETIINQSYSNWILSITEADWRYGAAAIRAAYTISPSGYGSLPVLDTHCPFWRNGLPVQLNNTGNTSPSLLMSGFDNTQGILWQLTDSASASAFLTAQVSHRIGGLSYNYLTRTPKGVPAPINMDPINEITDSTLTGLRYNPIFNLAQLSTSSTSTVAISSALVGTNVSFTIGTGLTLNPLMGFSWSGSNTWLNWLQLADAGNPTANFVSGTVVSYNSSTGALVLAVQAYSGSGTPASWVVNYSNAFGGEIIGSSTTSFTYASTTSGNQNFTITSGLNLVPGQTLTLVDSANSNNTWASLTNYLAGNVVSYNNSTGALVMNVTAANGSGTSIAAWNVYNGTPPGVTGSNSAWTDSIRGTADPWAYAAGLVSSPPWDSNVSLASLSPVERAFEFYVYVAAQVRASFASPIGLRLNDFGIESCGYEIRPLTFLNLISTSSTSTVSLATGNPVNFTVGTYLGIATGNQMRLTDTSGGVEVLTNFVQGAVTSYTPSTGALSLNVTSFGGTGTPSSWNVYYQNPVFGGAGANESKRYSMLYWLSRGKRRMSGGVSAPWAITRLGDQMHQETYDSINLLDWKFFVQRVRAFGYAHDITELNCRYEQKISNGATANVSPQASCNFIPPQFRNTSVNYTSGSNPLATVGVGIYVGYTNGSGFTGIKNYATWMNRYLIRTLLTYSDCDFISGWDNADTDGNALAFWDIVDGSRQILHQMVIDELTLAGPPTSRTGPSGTDPRVIRSISDRTTLRNNTPLWVNAVNVNVNSLGHQFTGVQVGTSSNNAIAITGLTSKSWTVTTGLTLATGQFVTLLDKLNSANSNSGTVTSYNSSTGALVVQVTAITGSGTPTGWTLWNMALGEVSILTDWYNNTGYTSPIPTDAATYVFEFQTPTAIAPVSGTGLLNLASSTSPTSNTIKAYFSDAVGTVSLDVLSSGSSIVSGGAKSLGGTVLNQKNVIAVQVSASQDLVIASLNGAAPVIFSLTGTPASIVKVWMGSDASGNWCMGNGKAKNIVCYPNTEVNPNIGTSTTSTQAIATGSLTFTVPAGMSIGVGAFLELQDASSASNFVLGFVTAYSGTSLTLNATASGGSGTPSSWNILYNQILTVGEIEDQTSRWPMWDGINVPNGGTWPMETLGSFTYPQAPPLIANLTWDIAPAVGTNTTHSISITAQPNRNSTIFVYAQTAGGSTPTAAYVVANAQTSAQVSAFQLSTLTISSLLIQQSYDVYVVAVLTADSTGATMTSATHIFTATNNATTYTEAFTENAQLAVGVTNAGWTNVYNAGTSGNTDSFWAGSGSGTTGAVTGAVGLVGASDACFDRYPQVIPDNDQYVSVTMSTAANKSTCFIMCRAADQNNNVAFRTNSGKYELGIHNNSGSFTATVTSTVPAINDKIRLRVQSDVAYLDKWDGVSTWNNIGSVSIVGTNVASNGSHVGHYAGFYTTGQTAFAPWVTNFKYGNNMADPPT